jgi:hypothetical protein
LQEALDHCVGLVPQSGALAASFAAATLAMPGIEACRRSVEAFQILAAFVVNVPLPGMGNAIIPATVALDVLPVG